MKKTEFSNTEKSEMSFHDDWAQSFEGEELLVYQAFETESSPENKKIIGLMGDLKGKKVLELGCGLGEASIYFAIKGATVTATDISPKMLEIVQINSKKFNVQIETIQVSANNLNNLQDNYYDFIYAGNLLHHVDIQNCINEIYKKLKPAGKAFFWDPIAYNPAINIYRNKANEVRTSDEHPLKIADFKNIQARFKNVEFNYFWLTGLYVFFKYYFIDKIDPNKERYWKKILTDSKKLETLLRRCHKIDQWLFKLVPGLKYWAWNVVVCAEK